MSAKSDSTYHWYAHQVYNDDVFRRVGAEREVFELNKKTLKHKKHSSLRGTKYETPQFIIQGMTEVMRADGRKKLSGLRNIKEKQNLLV